MNRRSAKVLKKPDRNFWFWIVVLIVWRPFCMSSLCKQWHTICFQSQMMSISEFLIWIPIWIFEPTENWSNKWKFADIFHRQIPMKKKYCSMRMMNFGLNCVISTLQLCHRWWHKIWNGSPNRSAWAKVTSNRWKIYRWWSKKCHNTRKSCPNTRHTCIWVRNRKSFLNA